MKITVQSEIKVIATHLETNDETLEIMIVLIKNQHFVWIYEKKNQNRVFLFKLDFFAHIASSNPYSKLIKTFYKY